MTFSSFLLAVKQGIRKQDGKLQELYRAKLCHSLCFRKLNLKLMLKCVSSVFFGVWFLHEDECFLFYIYITASVMIIYGMNLIIDNVLTIMC